MNAKQINQQYSIITFLSLKGFNQTSIRGSNHWYVSMIREAENHASFKVDTKKNLWYDHGIGEGGNLIDLACCIFKTDNVKEVIQQVLETFSSFQPQETIIPEKKQSQNERLSLISKNPIQDARLLKYLQRRCISLEITQQYCVELTYQNKDRHFKSIGFENILNGYELSSEGFKSCIAPKYITFIDNKGEKITIFEGFMDFLSYKMIPHFEIENSNYLILNSLSLLGRIDELLSNHKHIFLFLDNDKAGEKAATQIKSQYPNVVNMAIFYADYKDVNDFLTKNLKDYEQRFTPPTLPTKRPKTETNFI